MKSTRISSRYAKSLLSLVREQNLLEETLKDMRCVLSVCEKNKELRLLLQNPIVKTDKKKSILKQIFSNSLSKITLNFISIITSKKREMYLQAIARSFISQYKTFKKIETVIVTTTTPINNNTKDDIVSYVKKQGKEGVEISEVINKDIIGGIIVKMGDKQLDASVLTNIKKLKKTFNKNLYIKDF